MDVLAKDKFRLHKILAFVVLAALASLTLFALVNYEYQIFFSSGVCLLAGSIMFTSLSRLVFCIAYLLNISIGILISLNFEINNGSPFLGGGDDQLFYESVIDLARGFTPDVYLDAISYQGYLYTHEYFYRFLIFFFPETTSYIHMVILNGFAGAVIPALIYQICTRYFSIALSVSISVFIAFFPHLVYYSSIMLRDIWVAMFLVLVLHTLLTRSNFLVKIFIIALILYATLYFRVASMLLICVFILSYFFFSQKQVVLRFISVLLVSLIGVSFVLFPEVVIERRFDETLQNYNEILESSADEGSLGRQLRSSNNPIIFSIGIAYLLYSPLPPPFLKKQKLHYFIISLGCVLWYMMIPAVFFGIVRHSKMEKTSAIAYSYLMFLLVTLIVVNYSTGSARHIVFIYPVALVFAYDYIVHFGRRYRKFLFGYSLFLVSMLVLYIAFKL